MKSAAINRLESLLQASRLDRTLARVEEPWTGVSTGVPALDAVFGGWRVGEICELTGARSSGRTTVLIATLAAATARGEIVGLVDVLDRFDPVIAAAAGVDLNRVLWARGATLTVELARPAMLEQSVHRAIRAFDLIIRAGGFGIVALDLAGMPARVLQMLPFTTWMRLAHATEGRQTVGLIVGDIAVGRSARGVSVHLRASPQWVGASPQSRRFSGFNWNRSVESSIYRSIENHSVEEQTQLPNVDTMLSNRSIDRSTDRSIPDDFAAIHEVVLRRYRRVLEHGGPFPDLILIDGGKGQLTAAYAALREVGLDRLVAIGIAKQEELLFTRDRVEGLALPRESSALRLIQRIRDEAHRFAITFHRRSRTRRDLRSALDDVPGIGARRRKQLLTTFGSVAGVRRASRQELEAAVGAKTAEAVIKHFGGA
jgi:RecA/RadA recombinase